MRFQYHWHIICPIPYCQSYVLFLFFRQSDDIRLLFRRHTTTYDWIGFDPEVEEFIRYDIIWECVDECLPVYDDGEFDSLVVVLGETIKLLFEVHSRARG